MSDLEDAQAHVVSWLQALADDGAPCGADLEYDNDFLALTQAAAGKPESQFGPAEPPDWPQARAIAESLFERTRDLRVAIVWLRAQLHLQGWTVLAPGLDLLRGLLETHWDSLHPLPDPDDGDPYARANALALLVVMDGVLGDLHAATVVRERAIGELLGRDVALAAGLLPAGEGQTVPALDSARRTLAAAVEHTPALGQALAAAEGALRALQATVQQRFDAASAPEFKPLLALVRAVTSLMPAAQPAAGDGEPADAAGAGVGGGRVAGAGLTGAVTTRDEALRAIDMVCDFLERTEPSNPAPLFLRRARQLVNHSFLQLMKELAPDAMAEVARTVGVDPDTV